jgi:hypothetical protein
MLGFLSERNIMDKITKMIVSPVMKETKIKKDDLSPLGHMDIIKAGDYVFDDFNEAQFIVGENHPRVGTEYDSNIDMPIYRLKMPTRLTA